MDVVELPDVLPDKALSTEAADSSDCLQKNNTQRAFSYSV